MSTLFHSFFEDIRVQIALLLLVLDFVLGVSAALIDKTQGFRLSYVSDILRTDVLGKIVPFLALYAGYKYAKNADLVIPGFDMEIIMDAAWALMIAAVVGSILKSLTDLGIWRKDAAPPQIAGGDPTTPTVPAPPNP